MQNVTPLDIQKQRFSRKFRGYDTGEVRGFLHLISEEMERLLRENETLSRALDSVRDELQDHLNRERILKDTLLSAQTVAEEMRNTARRESEIIIRDAESAGERTVHHALQRVAELERAIQDLRLERKALRNRLTSTLTTFQQMLELDAEDESRDDSLVTIHRHRTESAG